MCTCNFNTTLHISDADAKLNNQVGIYFNLVSLYALAIKEKELTISPGVSY